MDLSTISTKPVLVLVTIDEEAIVKEFGEPLTFWTWDKQPLDTYLAISGSMGDTSKSAGMLRDLILDKEGVPVMTEGKILPAKVMVSAMTKVMELLGK